MAIKTSFFGNVDYYPSDFHNIFKSFINDGRINTNDLYVRATSTPSMNIQIDPGSAFLRGQFIYNDSIISLPIVANSLTTGRIDSIVLEIDNANSTTVAKVVKGTNSANPIAPTLSSSQLLLANILVNPSVIAIFDGDIKNSDGKYARVATNEFVAGDTLNTDFTGLKALRKWNSTIYKSVFGAGLQGSQVSASTSLQNYDGSLINRIDLDSNSFSPYLGFNGQVDLGRVDSFYRNLYLLGQQFGTSDNTNYLYQEFNRKNSIGMKGRVRAGVQLINDLPSYGITIAHDDSHIRSLFFNKDVLRTDVDGLTDIGSSGAKFKDGYFAGMLYAQRQQMNQYGTVFNNYINSNGTVLFENTTNNKAFAFNNSGDVYPVASGVQSLGLTGQRWLDGYFAGTVYSSILKLVNGSSGLEASVLASGTAQFRNTGGDKSYCLDTSGNMYPLASATQNLGLAGQRWLKVYSSQADDISSDIRLKENIEYIPNGDVMLLSDEAITTSDMLNFVTEDIKLAEYDYIGGDHQIGFIAQDIADTKVGKKIINEDNAGYLSYNEGSLIATLIGSIKELKKEIEMLKANQ